MGACLASFNKLMAEVVDNHHNNINSMIESKECIIVEIDTAQIVSSL